MFEGKSTISITIFNSYVKLPEGNGETKKNDWNAGFTKKKMSFEGFFECDLRDDEWF